MIANNVRRRLSELMKTSASVYINGVFETDITNIPTIIRTAFKSLIMRDIRSPVLYFM